jgi:flagellar biosynthesis/type III secretory pathway chaperone
MASLMENLIEVLEKESGEYGNLLELSMKKTPVIVAGNLEELAKITDEEQIVVGRINHLDAERQEAFADIANVINRDVTKLMLTDLIAMLAKRPQEQQKLAKVHDKLKTVVHEVERVNGQNRTLLENALEMVQFDINMLQSMKAAPETANYNRGAYNTGAVMGVAAKGFDAKQ